MSLTRRNWFVHRVLPTGALLGAAVTTTAAPAMAAQGSGKKSVLDKTQRLHPFLQVAAQQEPEKRISVIVTKRKNAKGGAHSDEIAKANGSSVKSDFDDFIRAFEMEVQAKRLPQLAKHPKVAYVTPNLKVRYNAIATADLRTAFNQTINVPAIWNGTTPATGAGVTVAVLDSGIRENHSDFSHGNVEALLINPRATGRNDKNGHGTHVAGIIKGKALDGRYIGVAPDCKLLGIQIADDAGASREADLIRALQWVNQNKIAKNIKVVNLSLNGAIPSSYLTNPICAAVETLMMRGVVVVVASGNRGGVANAVQFAPANDPHVITVGALDDNETIGSTDDSLAPFSSRGTTLDSHQKPDIVAPGRKIVAPLSSSSATLAQQFPERIVDTKYIRLSGTSMAAPVLSGVVALLLERYPNLKPTQVKWLLTQTMKSYPGQVGSAGVVDVAALFARTAQGNIGETGAGIPFNNTVAEGMASVQLQNTATYWDATYWDATYWDATYWDATYWDATAFDNATYEFFTDL
jgi:serine protease AprX